MESGSGKAILDGVEHELNDGFAVVVPAGASAVKRALQIPVLSEDEVDAEAVAGAADDEETTPTSKPTVEAWTHLRDLCTNRKTPIAFASVKAGAIKHMAELTTVAVRGFAERLDVYVEAAKRAGVETLAVLTGGFSEQELRGAGARDVFTSVEELAFVDTKEIAGIEGFDDDAVMQQLRAAFSASCAEFMPLVANASCARS